MYMHLVNLKYFKQNYANELIIDNSDLRWVIQTEIDYTLQNLRPAMTQNVLPRMNFIC